MIDCYAVDYDYDGKPYFKPVIEWDTTGKTPRPITIVKLSARFRGEIKHNDEIYGPTYGFKAEIAHEQKLRNEEDRVEQIKRDERKEINRLQQRQ